MTPRTGVTVEANLGSNLVGGVFLLRRKSKKISPGRWDPPEVGNRNAIYWDCLVLHQPYMGSRVFAGFTEDSAVVELSESWIANNSTEIT